jgi:hypothetical protein
MNLAASVRLLLLPIMLGALSCGRCDAAVVAFSDLVENQLPLAITLDIPNCPQQPPALCFLGTTFITEQATVGLVAPVGFFAGQMNTEVARAVLLEGIGSEGTGPISDLVSITNTGPTTGGVGILVTFRSDPNLPSDIVVPPGFGTQETGDLQELTNDFWDPATGLKYTLPQNFRIIVESDVDVIPEPSTFMLVVMGALGLLSTRMFPRAYNK